MRKKNLRRGINHKTSCQLSFFFCKQIALQEIQALEETIKRNTAEVKSSENLVEQYRQQATKTRLVKFSFRWKSRLNGFMKK